MKRKICSLVCTMLILGALFALSGCGGSGSSSGSTSTISGSGN